ncbi:hypothetical protein AXG93_4625s1130 [Marchantia polymorpha subsp. ruderalis]|uniref:Uncharacterized protein n=1 Tax=Marchantia polymorpha subsp. ruderalis TaxID=1480154 RepID=A0A176VTD4_MARPO|nr:hypothetical protein AXG93_4625s1130 [Marchantia polymorpha subsp. ruderalis]
MPSDLAFLFHKHVDGIDHSGEITANVDIYLARARTVGETHRAGSFTLPTPDELEGQSWLVTIYPHIPQELDQLQQVAIREEDPCREDYARAQLGNPEQCPVESTLLAGRLSVEGGGGHGAQSTGSRNEIGRRGIQVRGQIASGTLVTLPLILPSKDSIRVFGSFSALDSVPVTRAIHALEVPVAAVAPITLPTRPSILGEKLTKGRTRPRPDAGRPRCPAVGQYLGSAWLGLAWPGMAWMGSQPWSGPGLAAGLPGPAIASPAKSGAPGCIPAWHIPDSPGWSRTTEGVRLLASGQPSGSPVAKRLVHVRLGFGRSSTRVYLLVHGAGPESNWTATNSFGSDGRPDPADRESVRTPVCPKSLVELLAVEDKAHGRSTPTPQICSTEADLR